MPFGLHFVDACGQCVLEFGQACTLDCKGAWGGKANAFDCGLCDAEVPAKDGDDKDKDAKEKEKLKAAAEKRAEAARAEVERVRLEQAETKAKKDEQEKDQEEERGPALGANRAGHGDDEEEDDTDGSMEPLRTKMTRGTG